LTNPKLIDPLQIARGIASSVPSQIASRNPAEAISVVPGRQKEVTALSILWIILIIVLVLALLGFFSRGRW
jgi:preprotein translocase subunit SecY